MRLSADGAVAGASLLGIALARHLIGELQGLSPESVTLRFPYREKPYCPAGADFSISHTRGWVAALACASTRVGLDIETETSPQRAGARGGLGEWTAREAMLKACGAGLERIGEVQVGDGYCLWQQQSWVLTRPPAPSGVSAAIVSERPLSLSAREIAWQSLMGGPVEQAICA
jgi:phosphopantetheinyl transferase